METEVLVTTGDMQEEYDIIGPVYFQVSNKGVFSSTLSRLVKQYSEEIENLKNQGLMDERKSDWGFLYGEWSVGQSDFERAFFVAVQEIKKRAEILGADAVICMRQDIDLDTTAFQHFYLQMYGTAIRLKKSNNIKKDRSQSLLDPSKELCPHCRRESDKRFSVCEHCNKMKH